MAKAKTKVTTKEKEVQQAETQAEQALPTAEAQAEKPAEQPATKAEAQVDNVSKAEAQADNLSKAEMFSAISVDKVFSAFAADTVTAEAYVAGGVATFVGDAAEFALIRKATAEESERLSKELEAGVATGLGGAIDPAKSAVTEKLEELRAARDAELSELNHELLKSTDAEGAVGAESVNAEAEKLELEQSELNQKLNSLRTATDYKKTVVDAVIAERITQLLDTSIERSKVRQKSLAGRYDFLNKRYTQVLNAVNEAKQAVNQSKAVVCGTNTSSDMKAELDRQLRIQHDIIRESAEATALSAEIKAIETKISKLDTSANVDYTAKLGIIERAVKDVEEHRAKLKIKADIIQKKLVEVIAHNEASLIMSATKLGERCPVCDGYILRLKPFTPKDPSIVSAELNEVNAVIAKDDARLCELHAAAGEYAAATHVGAQYGNSLKDSLVQKRERLNAILNKNRVVTIAELSEKASRETARANEMNAASAKAQSLDYDLKTHGDDRTAFLSQHLQLVQKDMDEEVELLESLNRDKEKLQAAREAAKVYLSKSTADELVTKLLDNDAEYAETEKELDACRRAYHNKIGEKASGGHNTFNTRINTIQMLNAMIIKAEAEAKELGAEGDGKTAEERARESLEQRAKEAKENAEKQEALASEVTTAGQILASDLTRKIIAEASTLLSPESITREGEEFSLLSAGVATPLSALDMMRRELVAEAITKAYKEAIKTLAGVSLV